MPNTGTMKVTKTKPEPKTLVAGKIIVKVWYRSKLWKHQRRNQYDFKASRKASRKET